MNRAEDLDVYRDSHGIRHAKHIIRELERRIAELENPWVSVEERLPTEEDSEWPDRDVVYLIDGKNPEVNAAWAVVEMFDDRELNITHWMPIPERPKEEHDDVRSAVLSLLEER